LRNYSSSQIAKSQITKIRLAVWLFALRNEDFSDIVEFSFELNERGKIPPLAPPNLGGEAERII
jgi:hypothetical protein